MAQGGTQSEDIPYFNEITDRFEEDLVELNLLDRLDTPQQGECLDTESKQKNLFPNLIDLLGLDFDSDDHDSTLEDTSQLSLSRLFVDIKQDVLDLNDTDADTLGLERLFKEPQYESSSLHIKGRTGRSKAARKRKKQQKKLNKSCYPAYNKRPGFVNTFKELKQSTQYLDDEVDPSYTCPVCLEMYFMPTTCSPCGHLFCDPCLRALTSQRSENIACPLCRTAISRCDLDKELNDHVMDLHPEVYFYRSIQEQNSKVRHHQLPFTPPVPLGRRFMRHLIASRANQMETNWMSHDWFKFLLGCTVGICLSMLIMLLNRVKSINDVRDVNIVFLSCIFGATVTFIVFKIFKI